MCIILESPGQFRQEIEEERADREAFDRIKRFSRSVIIVYDSEEDEIFVKKFGQSYSLTERQFTILQDALVDMCILNKNI